MRVGFPYKLWAQRDAAMTAKKQPMTPISSRQHHVEQMTDALDEISQAENVPGHFIENPGGPGFSYSRGNKKVSA
ncbi:hypothetical protein [Pseudomonas sp. FME51]|uniref:hypothetical protein n=1 Tax=Pseudomonas sp. FME51 TaxID=2742609 RepID=UPI001868E4DC|nr:hypothetical protein [Pseudomonas sp. FME51]